MYGRVHAAGEDLFKSSCVGQGRRCSPPTPLSLGTVYGSRGDATRDPDRRLGSCSMLVDRERESRVRTFVA
jgi:hypothetical protein